MKNEIKILTTLFILILFLFGNVSAIKLESEKKEEVIISQETDFPLYDVNINDYEPNGNLEITVDIKEIRALDTIDTTSDPDFCVVLTVNDEEFKSDIWHDQKYISDAWSKTVDVPDNEENVSINIQLWDWNKFIDKQCDISMNTQRDPFKKDIDLIYSVKTGHWRGDDYIDHKNLSYQLFVKFVFENAVGFLFLAILNFVQIRFQFDLDSPSN